MNAKKFLVMVLVVGLIKICHGAPLPTIKEDAFNLPQTQENSVSVYPCLSCSTLANSNANCLNEALQAGVGVHITF